LGSAVATSTPPTTGAAFNSPTNILAYRQSSLTGTGTYAFNFFVPRVDASGAVIVSPDSARVLTSGPCANATYNWFNPRTNTTQSFFRQVCAQNLTMQYVVVTTSSTIIDSGYPGLTAQDSLQWTIAYDVSNYYNATSFILNTTISDGQTLSNASTSLLYKGSSATFPTTQRSIDTSRIGFDTNPATDGSTVISWNLLNALRDASVNLVSAGGFITGPVVGGNIRFTTFLRNYTDAADNNLYHGSSVSTSASAIMFVLSLPPMIFSVNIFSHFLDARISITSPVTVSQM
jgi:hypothetical protein